MAQIHAACGDIIDIQPLGPALRTQVTTALIKSEQLELIRIVLLAGKTMREHRVRGETTLLCIEGEIELATSQATRRLRPGQLVHLAAGEPHALEALSDASALLTIRLSAS